MFSSFRATILSICVGVLPAACLRVPEEFPEEPDGTPAAPSTVSEVLDRHVSGLGGEKALRPLSQRTVEARMVIHPEEGCEEGSETCQWQEKTGSFLFQTTAGGQMYRRNVIDEIVEERGFDGKVGWALIGESLRIDTQAEAVINREEAVLHWYFGVAERKVDTTLLRPREEDTDEGQRILDGVKWQVPGGPPGKALWFDRATGLRAEEVSAEGEGENQTKQVVTYEDYRDVDGVLVPHVIKVRNELGERAQEIEFIVQRVTHDPIDPTKFAIPELAKPKAVPDPALAELAGARAAAAADPKDIAAQMELARRAFVAAHFNEARSAANAALAIDKNEPEALVLVSRIEVLSGNYAAAAKTLSRAKKANVREEIIARERAWIHMRGGDYRKLADALDVAGNPVLAGRYRTFTGTPFVPKLADGGCTASIPLVAKEPLALVEVDIAGTKVAAIVDTGAADLIVTQSFAAELGLKTLATSQVAKGMPAIGHSRVEKIVAGGLTLENVPVNIFDDASIADMAGDEAKRVKAVLGIGALAQFTVALDVPGGKMDLALASKKCASAQAELRKGDSVPFWMHETHYIYVMASMNGAEGLYLVNTGMRGADMTANQAAYAFAAIGAPPMRADEAPMVRVAELDIGKAMRGKDLAAAYGYFQQGQTSDGFRIDGMLGLGVLGKTRFVIDFEQHRLYFPR